jgi:hypothetical protein
MMPAQASAALLALLEDFLGTQLGAAAASAGRQRAG